MYLQFWTFYCTKSDQNLKLQMKVNPVEGAPKATLKDYPTYCKPLDEKIWECDIPAKDCQEDEVIGTLGLVTDGGNYLGVGPTKSNGKAKRIDNELTDGLLYSELYDKEDFFYNNQEEFHKKTTSGDVKIEVATQPMMQNDMSIFKVHGYNSFVYFTFYCHASKKDYNFILKNANVLDKVSTYLEHPLETCEEDKETNVYVCKIENKECEEGEVLGTLATAAVDFYSYTIQMTSVVEHEVIEEEEEAPKQNLKECDEIPVVADFYTEEWGVYEELFRKIKEYDLVRTEDDGETYETEYYNVQIYEQPVDIGNQYLKHDNLVHITFYCTQGEEDAVFVLTNDPIKTEIASLSDHPTDCLYQEAEGKYHCDIMSKGCTEGDIVGALVFQNDEEITWKAEHMEQQYENLLHQHKEDQKDEEPAEEEETDDEFDDLDLENFEFAN